MSLYWKCQVTGWSALALWGAGVSTIIGGFNAVATLANAWVPLSGLVLTHLLRKLIHREEWKHLALLHLAPRVVVSAIALGSLMALLGMPFLLFRDEGTGPAASIVIQSTIGSSFSVLAWLLIYFSYHHLEQSQESREAELRLRAANRESELLALRTQLNPHFLFNSLNGLRALIDESPARAQKAVTHLASLLRYTLHLNRSSTVALRDELEAAENYLALEQIRFENRLRFRMNVSAGLLDQSVPPMLLQNLLENALKHGIARLPAGGEIVLAVTESGDRVHVRVSNPGRLAPRGPGEGVGLANAREQIRLLFGRRADLELREEGSGVVCHVVLPRRKQDSRESRPGFELPEEWALEPDTDEVGRAKG